MTSRSETLANKSVLITGANRGLGKALAIEYASHGCALHLVARSAQDLVPVTEEIARLYPSTFVHPWECNLSNTQEILSFCDSLLAHFSFDVDILINCAGVFPVNTLSDTSLEEYEHCMAVNVTAPFLLMREFSPGMAARGWGRIINIASSSAYGGGPKTSVYCAAKHALLGFSRSLYKELKEYGVRVQCISPGSIQTEMGRDVEAMGQAYDTFMTPAEVAEYIAYNSSFDGNLIAEEVRLNRVFIQ